MPQRVNQDNFTVVAIPIAPQSKRTRASCLCKIIELFVLTKDVNKPQMCLGRFLKASNWKSRTADLQAEQPSLASWSPLCSDQEVKHPRTRFTVSNTLKGSGRGRASPSANFWKRLQNLAYLQNHLPAS